MENVVGYSSGACFSLLLVSGSGMQRLMAERMPVRNLAKTLWTYTCPNHWTKNEAEVSIYQLGEHIERSERVVFRLTSPIGICPIGHGEVSPVRPLLSLLMIEKERHDGTSRTAL